ncbi:hypothetical protein D3C85_1269190 [compost metagenome]
MFDGLFQATVQRHDRAAETLVNRLQQLVSRIAFQDRLRVQSAAAKAQVDGFAVVHAVAEHPQRQFGGVLPAHLRAVEMEVAIVVQQADAGFADLEKLEIARVDVIEVAHAQVQLIVAKALDDLVGTQGRQAVLELGKAAGQALDVGDRVEAAEGYQPQAQVAHELAPARGGLGEEPVVGGQQGPGPRQYAFAGLGKTLEALAPGDQHQVQFILQVAQAHRQRGLGDVAARGRLAEVAGLLQGDQELELFDVHDGTC